jgi:hypothetical protein
LHIDYATKFTKDDTHDPALANFRQNAFHKYEITDGPHKGMKSDNSPLHDDSYTRADDHQHALTDQDFVSTDNPGVRHLSPDDVIDYTFSAEEMIIDTSQGTRSSPSGGLTQRRSKASTRGRWTGCRRRSRRSPHRRTRPEESDGVPSIWRQASRHRAPGPCFDNSVGAALLRR